MDPSESNSGSEETGVEEINNEDLTWLMNQANQLGTQHAEMQEQLTNLQTQQMQQTETTNQELAQMRETLAALTESLSNLPTQNPAPPMDSGQMEPPVESPVESQAPEAPQEIPAPLADPPSPPQKRKVFRV